jgi:hypothetical protein
MPSYDIRTAAFVVRATRKWVDNVASHHLLPGVGCTGRGVDREFSFEAVVLLAAVRMLTEELEMPLRRAVGVADEVCRSSDGTVTFPSGVRCFVDQDALVQEVRQRLLEAAESVPRIRRGRPRRHAGPPHVP